MINRAIKVNKAEQLAMGIPILGLINEKKLDVFVDPDPIKISFYLNSYIPFF